MRSGIIFKGRKKVQNFDVWVGKYGPWRIAGITTVRCSFRISRDQTFKFS